MMSDTDPSGKDFVAPATSQPIVFAEEPRWRFSGAGLFWAVIGVAAVVSGAGVASALIGLVAIAYSIYLFRGGRFSFIVW